MITGAKILKRILQVRINAASIAVSAEGGGGGGRGDWPDTLWQFMPLLLA